ncbi:hypothetical protein DL765_006825 [Monosporascus sp. GIB2]|nr:hypothetical protein DL765_006825 [Monosporascus sp. GIB2]
MCTVEHYYWRCEQCGAKRDGTPRIRLFACPKGPAMDACTGANHVDKITDEEPCETCRRNNSVARRCAEMSIRWAWDLYAQADNNCPTADRHLYSQLDRFLRDRGLSLRPNRHDLGDVKAEWQACAAAYPLS